MQIDTDNLDSLELATLIEARAKIDRAISTLQNRRERAFLDEITAKAKAEGIDVAVLAERLAKKAGPSNREPKYRHREKHTQTWTGRGKKPGWFEQFGEEIPSA